MGEIGGARAASAQQPAEPLRVELSAPAGCGTGDDFLRTVLARTGRARAAARGEAARTLHVEIVATDNGKLQGELSITEAAGQSASEKRSISSDSCHELVEALALFGALAVDPEASTEPLPSSPTPTPAPKPNPPRRNSPPPAPSAQSHVALGVDGGVLSAGTASLLPLVEPFVELSRASPTASRIAMTPSLRLAFSTTGGDTRPTADGPAHLHLTTVRLGGCPLELGIASTLQALPCVELGAGALTASGQTVAHPESHTLLWGSLGLAARLQWRPWPALSFEASGAVDLPFRRDHFYFDPASSSGANTFAYEAPRLLGRALFGAALHFL
jgi:hypothetical protein